MEPDQDGLASIQNDKSGFRWVGLITLLIGIKVQLRALEMPIGGLPLLFFIFIPLSLLLVFIRQYDWKNISVAVLLICTLSPVRVIFHWWLNPVLNGLAGFVCLIVLIRFIQRSGWKHGLVALLVLCVLLTGWQAAISASEVGQCYIDDIRWTHYFYCQSTGGQYQQIESLPIGMQGYCYYCPWYSGVNRW
jgi:hypothetical protein